MRNSPDTCSILPYIAAGTEIYINEEKEKRVDSFFQRTVSPRIEENTTIEEENKEQLRDENPPSISAVENATFSSIQRDPGVRQPIWNYPVNKRDEIRRAYLNAGPHRLMLPKYPPTGSKTHPRRFQAKWYSEYPWLEYSRITDRAYCFYCYLFLEEPSTNKGQDAFAINGFKNWNRVKGKHCSFMKHVGDGPNSQHNNAIRFCDALLNQAGHIDQVMQRLTDEEVRLNRLRVMLFSNTKLLISAAQSDALRGGVLQSGTRALIVEN
ncbi:zinc finger MYM-type protein 1 [Tanacetum coccineum]